jgi:hypothetical protein
MNQHVHQSDNDEIRPEYDFSHGVRGKHDEAYRAGTNVVFLEPDVARAFADSASVNHASRLLLQLARTNIPKEILMRKKTVEFNAHKKVKEPTEVAFTTKRGKQVEFVAEKKVEKPVHVKFRAKE